MISSAGYFETFTDAYLKAVHDILNYGITVEGVRDSSSVGSGFGTKNRSTKELLVYSFCVTSPNYRNLNVDGRNINKAYLLANFLWLLTGSKKASSVVKFNEKGKQFLDQRGDLSSAIGPHIFKFKDGKYFELSRIEQLLRDDPSTRRAVIQIFSQKDLTKGKRDVPCYNHMHFFRREEYLHCHVVMRSQSALMVLPYDYFLFSMIHEAMAVRLGIPLGKLHYTCNSIHIYEDELELGYKLKKGTSDLNVDSMSDFSDNTITNLKEIYRKIVKLDVGKFTTNIIDEYPIDSYWINLLKSHFLNL